MIFLKKNSFNIKKLISNTETNILTTRTNHYSHKQKIKHSEQIIICNEQNIKHLEHLIMPDK